MGGLILPFCKSHLARHFTGTKENDDEDDDDDGDDEDEDDEFVVESDDADSSVATTAAGVEAALFLEVEKCVFDV